MVKNIVINAHGTCSEVMIAVQKTVEYISKSQKFVNFDTHVGRWAYPLVSGKSSEGMRY